MVRTGKRRTEEAKWRAWLIPQDPLVRAKVTWKGTFGPACE